MISLFSPAKVNLFLRVISKRTDGYHNLSSLFQTISLGDTIEMELHSRDELRCQDPEIPLDHRNLILKAVDLFRKKTGINHSFRINLKKNIPTQAGLGGGSGNAATALWGCNALLKIEIPTGTLQEWSAEIGSDIPFFFSEGTAYCTGRGEIVSSLSPLPACSMTIVKPQAGLPTPEVYKRLNFPSSLELDGKDDLKNFSSGQAACYFNDLESPAFECLPQLKELKERLLQAGFQAVLMAGSGSAFICFGKGKLPFPDCRVFSACFLNRSADHWYHPISESLIV